MAKDNFQVETKSQREENSADIKKENVKSVDLESVIVDRIGQFGCYQARTVALAALVVVLHVFTVNSYVFTTARIESRCLIPECENPDNTDFTPIWLNNAIPVGESCQRYSTTGNVSDDSCPATVFDQAVVVTCKEYVYENTATVVYDFNLGCSEWQRSAIGSARVLGVLLATPLTGIISDRWGRRVALIINGLNSAWMGLLRYWAHTYIGFILSEFFEATFGAGTLACAYILMVETVGPKIRPFAAAASSCYYGTGQVLLGFIAWAAVDWRTLTLAIYIPQLLAISYFWIAPESIRWYMSKGRYKDAENELKKAVKVNKKEISAKLFLDLERIGEEEKAQKDKQTNNNEPWLIVQVLQNRPILIRMIICPIWWMSCMLVFYGLNINAVNITGSKYLNYIAVAAIEIPAYALATLLVRTIGRKPVLIIAFWICAACQIAYIFVPSDNAVASLTVYLIGKFAIASVIMDLYLYTAELFPTSHRHTLFAFCSMMGRAGAMIAPLTPALSETIWEPLPFVIFAGCSVVAGGLVLLAPETRGMHLPDTMEQAADFGKNNREKSETEEPDKGIFARIDSYSNK